MRIRFSAIVPTLFRALCFLLLAAAWWMHSGCAQISAPTGGPKDTLAPVLVRSVPVPNSTGFSGNRITLTFDEYIELKDLSSQLLISPYPKTAPLITSNLKTLTLRLKDSLLPETTYHIDLGNAVCDINEGNPLKNFSFTFSTGATQDSLTIRGRVLLAETGKTDSTLLVLLYRNRPDTAVLSEKPDYVARVGADGRFIFRYLPAGQFRLYALKDGDGNRYYSAPSERFAFLDTLVRSDSNESHTLYAYVEKKTPATPATPPSPGEGTKSQKADKKLKYTLNLNYGKLNLLKPLELQFSSPLSVWKADSIRLCDTLYRPLTGVRQQLDSSGRLLSLQTQWNPGEKLVLIVAAGAAEDTAGLTLRSSDTLRFAVMGLSEYGALKLKFPGIDLNRRPVLQFVEGEQVKRSIPLTSAEWSDTRMLPGEYELLILFDENGNGLWDPGHYREKRQPEKGVLIPQKIKVKADWDNEQEIRL